MIKRLFKRKGDGNMTKCNPKYLTVKREARVGERITVIKDGSMRFSAGQIVRPFEVSGDVVFVKHPEGRNLMHGGAALYHSEYEVIIENAVERIALPGDRIVLKNGGCEYTVRDSYSHHFATSAFGGFVIASNGAKYPDGCYYVIEEECTNDPHAKHFASLSQEVAQLKRRISELQDADKPINLTVNIEHAQSGADIDVVVGRLYEKIRKGLR